MLTIREDYHASEPRTQFVPYLPRPQNCATLADHMDRARLRGIKAKDHVFTEGDLTLIY